MIRLVAAEYRKLVSTWLWLWLLLLSVALVAGFTSLTIAFADTPENPGLPLTSAAGQQTLFATGGSAGALVAVLAAIGLTSEYRHKTVSATFLATPHRGRVVIAKLVTYALVGLGYGLAAVVATAAVALPWLAAKDIDVSLTSNGIPGTLAGVVTVTALYALLGVGLGALVREQVATIVGMLVYLFIVEQILLAIPALQSWTIYLPGAAAQALTQASLPNLELLEAWQGGLLLAAYALALAVIGTRVAVRRDVT